MKQAWGQETVYVCRLLREIQSNSKIWGLGGRGQPSQRLRVGDKVTARVVLHHIEREGMLSGC